MLNVAINAGTQIPILKRLPHCQEAIVDANLLSQLNVGIVQVEGIHQLSHALVGLVSHTTLSRGWICQSLQHLLLMLPLLQQCITLCPV